MLSDSDVSSRLAALQQQYSALGQGHVFRWLADLSGPEQRALLASLERIDIQGVTDIFQSLFPSESKEPAEQQVEQVQEQGEEKKRDIQPFTQVTDQSQASAETRASWRTSGIDAISKGLVSVMLMAGGQGTRLGSSEPKGCYDIGLPSGKSIFAFELEHVQSLRRLVAKAVGVAEAEVHVPVYVMTSIHTDAPTRAFFEQHAWFGLDPQDVFFFQQSLLPALTTEGKVILESKCGLALSPNGNGGVYESLRASGALADMRARGVQWVHVFGVDNVLVKIADPEFIGFAIESKTVCSNKVVLKQRPHEKVGVMCLRGGQPDVVEYSEITAEMAESVDSATGRLVYSAANIANHLFRRDFLEQVTELPWHVAHKKIPFCDEQGQTQKPSANNGVKLEMFIFDSFPLAGDHMTAFAVPRESEFSPVKNAPGEGVRDSPATALAMINTYHRSLAEAAGAAIAVVGGEDNAAAVLEIDPSLSYDGENLASLQGKTLELGAEGFVVTSKL
jgi:UDP-N-acetylglucosamine/UDP-N-acetylgalactosamine diphosphorylase